MTVDLAPAPALALRGRDLSPARLRTLTDSLAAQAPTHDRAASFPWPGIRAVHDSGLLTLSVGERYGGRRVSATETLDVFLALGEGDPSVALITAMTVVQHAVQDAASTWPAHLYERVLAESSDAPTLINAIRAEPELGAPARGGLPATLARRTAEGWSVSGRKAFATGSEGLAYHAVWAVTDEVEPRIGHVIVPAETPGIRIETTWDHLGMRASSTHDIVYTDVEVPFENFSGAAVGAAPNNPTLLGGIALAVPALYLGVARAALAAFGAFARERVPTSLGRPIATTERIQTVAGEALAEITQAELVLSAVAADIDAGAGSPARLGLVKLLVSRGAITAVQGLVAAIGNPGLSRHLPFERHLRDVLASRPHPPQDDAALLIAGRALLHP